MTKPTGLMIETLVVLFLSVGSALSWESATPQQVGMDESRLQQARDYALTGGGSGCIIRGGKLVMSWGGQTTRYDLKSTTKSIGVTVLGLAIEDGLMNLDDKAQDHYPDIGIPPNAGDGRLADIKIWHLATHTAGFDKPGGFEPLLFDPGTAWAYTDGGANWLADCLTLAYRQDLKDFMFDRVFSKLGITDSDLTWRNNAYRPDTIEGVKRREFGSGISANVDAMAKIGYLYLRRGRWGQTQIIPESFIDIVRKPFPEIVGLPVHNPSQYFNASDHYSLLWWNNSDGSLSNIPRDAYWSCGLYDSLIVVIPSLDMVVARAGPTGFGGRKQAGCGDYSSLEPFLEPICQSVAYGAPYPHSEVITSLAWAPASAVVRKATGSDNWPITWADDDNLYTAYGDGWGFEPKMPNKLSMGFAKVIGPATDFAGVNVRSPDEQYGDGASGKKGCGMLMVDGILYMWVRNANNSGQQCELWWSTDYAQNWTKSDWKFEEFGYPTFINFGKNYAGAPDNYVYTVSHDNPSAYEAADRFILMRVPKDKITQKDSYEFFKQLAGDVKAVWTSDINQRGAVFTFQGRCRRSGISYNAGIGRYLWWQMISNGDHRSGGGFGVYDAPNPWGPWRAAYFIDKWDMGVGETGSFPVKWMSGDGKTIYLVFSGNDAFSVRKATLTTSQRCGAGSAEAGDLNNDGIVDFEDLAMLACYWRPYVCSEPAWCKCSDFDQSGSVDFYDLARLTENWQRTWDRPPMVNITAPLDGAKLYFGRTVEIQADASDVDGSVVKVEFFADGNPIGEDNDGTDSWKTNWFVSELGSHIITAKATDDDGLTATSSAVTVEAVIPPRQIRPSSIVHPASSTVRPARSAESQGTSGEGRGCFRRTEFLPFSLQLLLIHLARMNQDAVLQRKSLSCR